MGEEKIYNCPKSTALGCLVFSFFSCKMRGRFLKSFLRPWLSFCEDNTFFFLILGEGSLFCIFGGRNKQRKVGLPKEKPFWAQKPNCVLCFTFVPYCFETLPLFTFRCFSCSLNSSCALKSLTDKVCVCVCVLAVVLCVSMLQWISPT